MSIRAHAPTWKVEVQPAALARREEALRGQGPQGYRGLGFRVQGYDLVGLGGAWGVKGAWGGLGGL